MDMEMAALADEPWIRQLLTVSGLPHEDITPAHLHHFWVIRGKEGIVAVVGLEKYGRIALLRSLAVDPRYRNQGWGALLVKKADEYADSLKIQRLYLLTLTAESFFLKRGYRRIERDAAPQEIKGTAEFQGLCPTSSALMVKDLGL